MVIVYDDNQARAGHSGDDNRYFFNIHHGKGTFDVGAPYGYSHHLRVLSMMCDLGDRLSDTYDTAIVKSTKERGYDPHPQLETIELDAMRAQIDKRRAKNVSVIQDSLPGPQKDVYYSLSLTPKKKGFFSRPADPKTAMADIGRECERLLELDFKQFGTITADLDRISGGEDAEPSRGTRQWTDGIQESDPRKAPPSDETGIKKPRLR